MARVNLTDAKVRALQPRARRFDVQDALLPGLVVHVTPTGHKSFMFKRRAARYQRPWKAPSRKQSIGLYLAAPNEPDGY